MPDPTPPPTESPDAVLARWRDRLDHLIAQVKGWVEPAGWRTRRIEKSVEERGLGRYTVPVLLMEKDTVEVVLNPVSPRVADAEGAVDLYLAPAYDDIATLYLESGRWVLYYTHADAPEPGPRAEPEGRPLSQAVLVEVLGAIVSHVIAAL